MKRIRCDDAEIAYWVLGDGPPVVLLHPFPANHEIWLAAAGALSTRYRVVMPDLRGHGDSEVGVGPATMAKHAGDISRICDEEDIGRAAFAGVSIGGYILFEFWRRLRGRIAALVLADTRAQAETADSRANRLRSAAEVLEHGSEPFFDTMIPKLLGKTTVASRPDLVAEVRRMMRKMSPEDINLVQQGMAERPDSLTTLKTINVPTLILVGGEDTVTTIADAEMMRQNIPGAQLNVIERAGHYAVYERSEEAGNILRQFLDAVYHGR
jgi:3-oxoadipate enol-lactonase